MWLVRGRLAARVAAAFRADVRQCCGRFRSPALTDGLGARGPVRCPLPIVALRLPRAVTCESRWVGPAGLCPGALFAGRCWRNPAGPIPTCFGISGGGGVRGDGWRSRPVPVPGRNMAPGVLGGVGHAGGTVSCWPGVRCFGNRATAPANSASSSILLVGVMMASFAAAATEAWCVVAGTGGRKLRADGWFSGWLGGPERCALDPIAAWDQSRGLLALMWLGPAGARRPLRLKPDCCGGDLQGLPTQGVRGRPPSGGRLVIVAAIATGWAVALAGGESALSGFVAARNLARFAVGNDQKLGAAGLAVSWVGHAARGRPTWQPARSPSPVQLPVGRADRG